MPVTTPKLLEGVLVKEEKGEDGLWRVVEFDGSEDRWVASPTFSPADMFNASEPSEDDLLALEGMDAASSGSRAPSSD